jgi:hypothetical protein
MVIVLFNRIILINLFRVVLKELNKKILPAVLVDNFVDIRKIFILNARCIVKN